MAGHKLPFEVGEDIELRSFVKGFRGAWFRCKIKKIGWRNGHLSCAIEYRDFPDEKVSWEKIYQNNPAESKRSRKTKTMMIRPAFPPIYQESKRPDINTISEVVVTVRDTWKVGDLVDWWKDGCYWSAKVAKVLGDKKVKVELPAPPVGEGETNVASCEDLRPSLVWSLENGWTVPTSKEKENGNLCAQLIMPDNQGIIPSLMPQSVGDGRMDVQGIAAAKPSLPAVDTSTAKTNKESDTGIVAGGVPSLIPQSVGDGRIDVQTVPGAKPSLTAVDTSTAKTNTESDTGIVAGGVPSLIPQSVGDGRIDVQTVPGAMPSLTAANTPTSTTYAESDDAYSESRRTSCSNSVPNLHVNDAATEMGETSGLTNALDNNRSLKRTRTDEGIVLNVMRSDTFEAALCDLEELINRINWMKNALDNGIPLTGAMGPRWKILETIPQPPQDEGCHSLRYEDQKRRDWNTFGNYLKNLHPPLSLSCCSAAHVIEFLRYLDQFGKTKVHTPVCPFYGQSNPPAPCSCPLRQAWGSLDSIVGRLRAAFEENGGKPEVNPFGDKAIKLYLREIRDLQSRARGIHHKKEGKMSSRLPSQPPPPRGANW